MTLPITRILPTIPNFESLEESQKYLNDLTFELKDMYNETAEHVNGTFRSSLETDGSEWVPAIRGDIIPGDVTYGNRIGFVLRQGIMTEIWFDVEWTTIGGATGPLSLDLPYLVGPQANINPALIPFVGAAFSAQLTYMTPGQTSLTVTPVANSFAAFFHGYGSGPINASPLQIQANGRVGGSVRYIGIADK